MKAEIYIREASPLDNSFAPVPTADWVDVGLLEQGDESPFYVTLKIAEFPRVSENQLIYDEELVTSIFNQIQGRTGIRGHIAQGLEATSYPVGEAYWVGASLVDGILYAKAYIPPGPTREDLRRRKAIGGGVGTSIYGLADRELNDDGTWYARDFVLQQIDFTAPEQASLQMGGEFMITAETVQSIPDMKESDTPMTTTSNPTITLEDVPADIREKILETSTLGRQVAELTTRLTTAERRLKEMGDITATVKLNVPDGADQMERIRAMTDLIAGLQSAFGNDVTVDMMTSMKAENEALAADVETADVETFEAEVDKEVDAMFETWQVSSDHGKRVVESLKRQLRQGALAQLSSTPKIGRRRDRSGIKEAVASIASGDLKVLIETSRDSLTGGRAYVGSSAPKLSQPTPEQIAAARQRTGI